jgi:hypothetical protein
MKAVSFMSTTVWHKPCLPPSNLKITIMKSFMLIPAIALMMVSCNTDNDKSVVAKDASALKIEALEQQLEQQKMETLKQNAIDSMQMINELKIPMAIAAAPAQSPVKTKVVYVREPRKAVAEAPVAEPTPTVAEAPTVADAPAPTETAPVATAPEPAKKKGWSNTAKGAVIGAGVGAIGGAVISKDHRVKGAIIGGVIGAAAGAGTGIILDHKKKKAAEYQY